MHLSISEWRELHVYFLSVHWSYLVKDVSLNIFWRTQKCTRNNRCHLPWPHFSLLVFIIDIWSYWISQQLQPGDLTTNSFNATSLFGLSGVTKHIQPGFFCLPLPLPHESGGGIILQKEVGCVWGKRNSVCVLWCIVQPLCSLFASLIENTKCFVFVSAWVLTLSYVQKRSVFPTSGQNVEIHMLYHVVKTHFCCNKYLVWKTSVWIR